MQTGSMALRGVWLLAFLGLLVFGATACDCGDDDDDDDDNDDHGIDDDDTTDDDTGDDDDDDVTDLTITYVDGGGPGYYGTSLAMGPAGEVYVAATNANSLFLYTYTDKGVASEFVADHATTPALAIDGAGNLYVAFVEVTDDSLALAENSGGAWTISTAESHEVYGTPSLAVAATGEVHLAYFDVDEHRFRYAFDDGSGWSYAYIEATDDMVVSHAIDLDGFGHPHVCYFDTTDSGLNYATNAGGTWQGARLQSGNIGGFCDIVADDIGRSYISYLDGNTGDLRLDTNATGPWTTQVIDDSGYVGYYTSIARDDAGHLFISHQDSVNETLLLSEDFFGAWNKTVLDASGHTGYNISLALDAAADPNISYFDLTGGALRFLRRTIVKDAAAELDAADLLSGPLAIATDADGVEHLIFGDYSLNRFVYATNAGGSWAFTTLADITNSWFVDADMAVDSAGVVHVVLCENGTTGVEVADYVNDTWSTRFTAAQGGGSCSLAIDSTDHAHVSYYDATEKRLVYATDASGSWATEVVAGGGGLDAGERNDIAVGPQDEIHVAFQNRTNLGVVHGVKSGDVWSTENVTDIDAYGLSLAVDSTGRAHVTYGDVNNHRVLHADNTNGTFQVEVVAVAFSVFTSLVMDENDHPHVLFNADNRLTYATSSGAAWKSTILERGSNVAWTGAMTAAPDGSLHAAFDGGAAIWRAMFPAGYTGK